MTAPHFVRPDHYPLPTGKRSDGVGHDGSSLARRPRQSTAPAGLWAPQPEVIAEKATKAKRVSPQDGNVARQKPCGTEAAAKRHVRNKEPLCEVCEAGRAERRKTERDRTARPATSDYRCGTKRGYDDHLARKERTCQPCKDAMAADARRRYAERTKALTPPTRHDQCGSLAGRAAHRRRGEKVCYLCREARNEADRKRHNEEKAA